MTDKHTPGPWTVQGRIDDDGRPLPHIDVVAHDGLVVAHNLFIRDANLIASLPALLADYRRVRAALRGANLCLTEHLSQAAHENETTVEELCPCFTVERAEADNALRDCPER